MTGKVEEVLKKFEQEHEVYVDAQDTKAYWVITARIPKSGEAGIHNLHKGIRFVTASYGDGNVLVMNDPERAGNFFIETWEKSKSFDDFVEIALKRILEEKNAADKSSAEGCGSGCV
jgi:hypothetical protein